MQVLQTHIASYNQVPRSVDWLPPTLPSPLSASGMDAQELREFMAQYVSELADLTFNSKPIINTLTMLASENVKAASSIAAAIEKHILKCSPTHKLYGLYLMDSIIKNVRQPYTSLFSRTLPEVYMNAWSAAPQSRPQLQKLFNFWKGHLPDQTLAAITKRQGAQQHVPAARPATRQTASSVYAQQPVRLADPRLSAAPLYSQAPLPAPPSPQPQLGPAAGYGAAAPFAAPPSPPSRPTSAGPQAPGVQQFPPGHSLYPAAAGIAQPYAAVQLQQFPPPPPPRQPSPQAPQPADAFPGFPQLPGPAQPSAAVMAALQAALAKKQQQQSGNAARQQPAASSVSEDDYWAGLEPDELPLKTVDERKMGFDSERLKAQSPAVLKELMACTVALRHRHLDRMFHHRRRTRGAGRRVLSQQWYVRADDWIAGTAADAQAAPAFFDLPEGREPVKKETTSVPVDDAQPNCALSGERFETFWDDASDEWRYKDALRLDADQAARYGLHEGVIVKVTALSAGPDPVLEEQAAAEGQSEEPAAAAAPAPEAPEPAAASTSKEAPAPSNEVGPSVAVKTEPEAAAAAEDAAMEAADQVEGADQQEAASSVLETVEASGQLSAGVTVKRESDEQLPRRRSKRLKQDP